MLFLFYRLRVDNCVEWMWTTKLLSLWARERMLLRGGKWESIERRGKLCGVVSWRKSKVRFHLSVCDSGLAGTTVTYCTEVGATYLATTYQRQCSKELFKFHGRWLTHIWCAFSLLESCAFDGKRGRRGFVIEVKNNKATACWPALPVQRPWYESNALCMPLRTSKDTGKHVAFDPAFLLLSFIWPILQNCHWNSEGRVEIC